MRRSLLQCLRPHDSLFQLSRDALNVRKADLLQDVVQLLGHEVEGRTLCEKHEAWSLEHLACAGTSNDPWVHPASGRLFPRNSLAGLVLNEVERVKPGPRA